MNTRRSISMGRDGRGGRGGVRVHGVTDGVVVETTIGHVRVHGVYLPNPIEFIDGWCIGPSAGPVTDVQFQH